MAFSITFTHDGADKRLRLLRRDEVLDDAVRAIPLLTEWIDSSRAQPISRALPGLISVGDAVCTTTPLAGRGVTLALMQARELIGVLDRSGGDITGATTQFENWCRQHIRPWFDDHRYTDADRIRRWSGGDVDSRRRSPSDLIVAAAEADDALKDLVNPYITMDALPASLAPAQVRATAIYAAGWRPPVPDGPTRAELSEVVSRTPAAA